MAYYQIEPFGEERADYRQALTTCVIANVNRDKNKKPTPFEPEDFMLSRKQIKEQSWEKDKETLMAFCESFKKRQPWQR